MRGENFSTHFHHGEFLAPILFERNVERENKFASIRKQFVQRCKPGNIVKQENKIPGDDSLIGPIISCFAQSLQRTLERFFILHRPINKSWTSWNCFERRFQILTLVFVTILCWLTIFLHPFVPASNASIFHYHPPAPPVLMVMELVPSLR